MIQCEESCLITADSPRSPGEKEESQIPRKEVSGLDPMSACGESKGKGVSTKERDYKEAEQHRKYITKFRPLRVVENPQRLKS